MADTILASQGAPRAWKMGSSALELMATMVLASFMPARCWIAPLMPTAMYRSGATTCPVCPTCSQQAQAAESGHLTLHPPGSKALFSKSVSALQTEALGSEHTSLAYTNPETPGMPRLPRLCSHCTAHCHDCSCSMVKVAFLARSSRLDRRRSLDVALLALPNNVEQIPINSGVCLAGPESSSFSSGLMVHCHRQGTIGVDTESAFISPSGRSVSVSVLISCHS